MNLFWVRRDDIAVLRQSSVLNEANLCGSNSSDSLSKIVRKCVQLDDNMMDGHIGGLNICFTLNILPF